MTTEIIYANNDCNSGVSGCEFTFNKEEGSIEPMNWSLIKSFHKNPPTIQLPRETKVIERYQRTMKLIKKNKTIPEYLFDKYFSNGETIVFVKNDFPYFTTSNIIHCLLWINPSFKILDTCIKEVINSKIPSSIKLQEFIYFENHGNNKSIQEIRHFHVFIKLL